MPSEMLKNGEIQPNNDYSPPSSPKRPQGRTTSTVSAQMRTKLFLKQSHGQWKSLGSARLRLFQLSTGDKQLVVENEKKTLISTIVLQDAVERIGKTGVALELSDQGSRTGIVYMMQLRSESSASGLFGELLAGSDRTTST